MRCALGGGGGQGASLETWPVNHPAFSPCWQFARSLRVGRLLEVCVEQGW